MQMLDVLQADGPVALARKPDGVGGAIQHCLEYLHGRAVSGRSVQIGEQRQKRFDCLPRRWTAELLGVFRQIADRNWASTEGSLNRSQAARWRVQDARECRRVVGVVDQPQVSQKIADFGTDEQVGL